MTLINTLLQNNDDKSQDSDCKNADILYEDNNDKEPNSTVTEKNIFESYPNRGEQKNTGSRGTVSSCSSIAGVAYVSHDHDEMLESEVSDDERNDNSAELILTEESSKMSNNSLKELLKSFGGGLKVIRKKNVVIISSMLLICCALILNQMLFTDNELSVSGGDDIVSSDSGNQNNSDENSGISATDDSDAYFASAAINRKRARDESLEVLEMVVQSEEALQESKDDALNSMTKIAAQIEQEANIESLVEAKGFSDCVAVVSDNSATIIVSSDGLLANQIAQITEIVCEQTDLSATGIKIFEKPTT